MHAHIIIQKYPIDTKHTCTYMTNIHLRTSYVQLHYLAHTIVKIDAYSVFTSKTIITYMLTLTKYTDAFTYVYNL